jgi:hypothetical protein
MKRRIAFAALATFATAGSAMAADKCATFKRWKIGEECLAPNGRICRISQFASGNRLVLGQCRKTTAND